MTFRAIVASRLSSSTKTLRLCSTWRHQRPSPILNAHFVRVCVRVNDNTHYSQLRYLTSASRASLVPNDKKVYKLPSESLEKKIQYAISQVPVGSMDADHVKFCEKAIETVVRNPRSNATHLSEKLLSRLVDEASMNSIIKLKPSVYNRTIRAFARMQTNDDFERTLKLFENMQLLHKSSPDQHPAPNKFTYSAVLYACSLSKHPEAISTAEKLVREMEASDDFLPDTSIYNNLIFSWANRADEIYGAATAAEDWLMHVSKMSTEGKPAQIDTTSFNGVLKAWCICPEENGANRALEILNLMLELQEEHNNDQIKPDSVSFNTVITAYCRRRNPKQAELVFQMALEYFLQQKTGNEIDLTNCLNNVVTSWAKSGLPEAAERAETISRDAYRLVENGPSHRLVLRPNAATHTICISAHVRNGCSMDRAEALLEDMVESVSSSSVHRLAPTTTVFNTVIHGWLRSGRPESAERATKLLRTMLNLAETKGVSCGPDIGSFNMCIELCCQHGGQRHLFEAMNLLNMAEMRKLTNSFAYKRLINALCRSGIAENAHLAADVLRRFEQQVDSRMLDWEEPSVVGLYTSVIAALAKTRKPEAAELAHKLLRGMNKSGPRRLEATTRTYTAVLSAFSKLHTDRAGQVVYKIFEEMEQLDANPESKIVLDRIAFAVTLETLAGIGGTIWADKAHSVLARMLKLFRTGRAKLEPDSRCYDACLIAMTRTSDPSYATKPAQLIKTLILEYRSGDLSELPSAKGFNAVIRCCEAEGSNDLTGDARELKEVLSRLSRGDDIKISSAQ